ncbi:hypothetical protein [Mesorhizobium sp.]|uniref:hypothetical protein n=1 Tax=Mesorhizobium sp. TaxID=1871066 RepID=UPI0025EB42AC|nr:hypothetical protein [Mesorhizobium sp.]
MMIPPSGLGAIDAPWRHERRSTIAARAARATGDGNDLRAACRWLEPAKICFADDMAEKATVCRGWPCVARSATRARKVQADDLFDKTLQIADDGTIRQKTNADGSEYDAVDRWRYPEWRYQSCRAAFFVNPAKVWLFHATIIETCLFTQAHSQTSAPIHGSLPQYRE